MLGTLWDEGEKRWGSSEEREREGFFGSQSTVSSGKKRRIGKNEPCFLYTH